MLARLAVPLLAVTTAVAQQNAVPGLDARVYDITDLAYYGRQGAAYPNGEAGFMVGHSHANCGAVNIPWVSTGSANQMIDTYPRIAFLLARESGGRMVQITGKSFCKHSETAYNFTTGPCLPCTAGGGSYFFVGCSDTYSSGINSSQFHLGPTTEINPWLGSWSSVGSYFDQGDPSVGGAAAIDNVRSLTYTQVQSFGPIKNMMIVREQELVTGATYYAQVHAVYKGEPVANRVDNLVTRGATITYSGGSWNPTITSAAAAGSVLARWNGATRALGGNGLEDGRFEVAVKVTGPVAGMWHYEYAIHNVDNDRGGASLRIPVDPGATVQNVGFHDIDGDALNDWTFSQSATELMFDATANNPLDWNTIYNVWFDCSVAPNSGLVAIDEARVGPGALFVEVASQVPSSSLPGVAVQVGHGCGSCYDAFHEFFAAPTSFDLSGQSLAMTLQAGQYTIGTSAATFIAPTGAALPLGDDSEATVSLPFALPYPGGTTSQLRVCSNGFLSPAASNGTDYTPNVAAFYVGQPRWAAAWHDFAPVATGVVRVDSSPARVVVTWDGVPDLGGTGASTFQCQFEPNGTVHMLWQSMSNGGNGYLVGWSPGLTIGGPGHDLSQQLPATFHLCSTSFQGLTLATDPRPALGATVAWNVGGIAPSTLFGWLLVSTIEANPPVDLTALGMPGCELYVASPLAVGFTPSAGSASLPMPIPVQVALLGLTVAGQAAGLDAQFTPSGLFTSNGVVLTVGM